MDAANVEVISKHIIKPSSSTPSHLKTLKLSLLDQLAPPIYVPLILFYQPDEIRGLNTSNHPQIYQKLKQSLSGTLALFYPLAGELNQENFTVDCNDNGAEFIEARVHARLSDVIHDPSSEQIKLYLPFNPNGGLSCLLAVQVNFFDCGGIAIGMCLSHQIGDGVSAVVLLNAWGKVCRGEKPEPPIFGLFGRHFQPKEKFVAKRLFFDKEKLAVKAKEKLLVSKRFLFDKEKIATLKREATSSQSPNIVEDPTRVELVSAFIWKNLLSDAKMERNDTIVATHAINLRPRTKTITLGDDLGSVFGNFFFLTAAYLHGASFDQYEGGSVPELSQFVGKLRHAIRRIDEEYTRSEDNYFGDMRKLQDLQSMGGVESCVFSSWCRFPVYEVDYGWGKPFWVGTTNVPLNNLACLLSTKFGDGIEAWVNMTQDDATTFETQFKLLGTMV